MIKPTIGRVVWFWSDEAAWQHPDAQPFPAIVTFVHSDDCVNLVVFDKNGDSKACPVVALWQADGEQPRPLNAHCEWMPYQKTQAAKQESSVDTKVLEERILRAESELSSMRQFIGSIAKDVVQRQGGPVENTQDIAKPQPPSLLKPASQIPPPAVPGKPDGFA